MTLPQLFHALINELRSQPENSRVDMLLANLASRTAAHLHEMSTDSLKLACMNVTNPEPYIAADLLLRHYGFVLRVTNHHWGSHYISIRRHANPNPTTTGQAHPTTSTTIQAKSAAEGAQVA